MTLCDYFAAIDDQAAAAVAHMPGGPAQCALDTVSLKGIDPVVAVARLEGIATGCTYEEASRRPRSGRLLSPPEADGPLVFSLSDSLIEALVTATPDGLVRFAEPWSQAEELQRSQVDVDTAAGVLEALAGLASRAQGSGMGLYCWWSL
ncbi:hypothetical protein WDV06_06610 [Streptomyces racemochromogenes]|uniref:Uncharacterized protein n=1 Tax=Streptomyces racemochromogenes TaxID=67353 RepID=A0ABW7P8X2_9ACTN